jgi:hypothetical protein
LPEVQLFWVFQGPTCHLRKLYLLRLSFAISALLDSAALSCLIEAKEYVEAGLADELSSQDVPALLKGHPSIAAAEASVRTAAARSAKWQLN